MKNLELYKPPQDMRELNLLQELEKNPDISQRELSNKFGIALGVTNACLRRMARRGWIRISGLNHRRIGYYLTPKGLAEKTRLTLQVVSWTVRHYSMLKEIIGKRLLEMDHEGMRRLVFYGVSEEMEVAYVTLQGVNLKLMGIVEDDEKFKPRFLFGYELDPVSRVEELKPDCILITTLTDTDLKRNRLETILKGRKLLIRDICP